MTPLAVGPILALVGIVAAFFVLRGKAKTRKSMYRTLRERREVDLRKARERATAAKGAAERTAIEREAAAQAAAAAATIQTPAEATPAYTPPPPPPPSPTPAYTPQEPTYSPPEPSPAPVEQAPAEVLPEPPPGDQTKPSWEIVQPEKPEAEGIPAAAGAGMAPSKASWELDPREQQRMDELYKKHGRIGGDEEEDDTGEESLGQVLLSYAGLVLALLVILLGILFMIGGKATH